MGQTKRILIADSSDSGFEFLAEAGQQGGNAGYSKLIVFAGKVYGVRPDGKLVEVDAGMTAFFGETEVEVYGTTKEDVKAFLEAVGAEALLDGEPGEEGGEGEDGGWDSNIDEILDQLQEDGFILDDEPEEEEPYEYPEYYTIENYN